jgi:hypothetical protein
MAKVKGWKMGARRVSRSGAALAPPMVGEKVLLSVAVTAEDSARELAVPTDQKLVEAMGSK